MIHLNLILESIEVRRDPAFLIKEKEMGIDFNTVVTFSNGVQVLNCTPHSIMFLDGDVEVLVEKSGATLLAKPVETPVGERGGAQLVRTVFETSPQGLAELEEIETTLEATVLVVGSIVSAQAYSGRVVGMIPAAGFERAAPPDKRYSTEKFTTF